jgi:hypothetical protein
MPGILDLTKHYTAGSQSVNVKQCKFLITSFVLCMHETSFLTLQEEYIVQGCTNPQHQLTRATEFCAVTPNICGFSMWKLFHVIWHLEFWGGFQICGKFVHHWSCRVKVIQNWVLQKVHRHNKKYWNARKSCVEDLQNFTFHQISRWSNPPSKKLMACLSKPWRHIGAVEE